MSTSIENENRGYPVYTMEWFWKQMAYIMALASVLALVAGGIGNIAEGRNSRGLLMFDSLNTLSDSISYCFALISISLITLMIIEVAFRKHINMLQYGLIAAALCLFYFMLLAFAEIVPFVLAYAIVSFLIIGMVGIFVDAITQELNAAIISTGILAAEYVVILVLISINAMALLVESLMLFCLIALAMYFTVKLRIKDNELTLKK